MNNKNDVIQEFLCVGKMEDTGEIYQIYSTTHGNILIRTAELKDEDCILPSDYILENKEKYEHFKNKDIYIRIFQAYLFSARTNYIIYVSEKNRKVWIRNERSFFETIPRFKNIKLGELQNV